MLHTARVDHATQLAATHKEKNHAKEADSEKRKEAAQQPITTQASHENDLAGDKHEHSTHKKHKKLSSNSSITSVGRNECSVSQQKKKAGTLEGGEEQKRKETEQKHIPQHTISEHDPEQVTQTASPTTKTRKLLSDIQSDTSKSPISNKTNSSQATTIRPIGNTLANATLSSALSSSTQQSSADVHRSVIVANSGTRIEVDSGNLGNPEYLNNPRNFTHVGGDDVIGSSNSQFQSSPQINLLQLPGSHLLKRKESNTSTLSGSTSGSRGSRSSKVLQPVMGSPASNFCDDRRSSISSCVSGVSAQFLSDCDSSITVQEGTSPCSIASFAEMAVLKSRSETNSVATATSNEAIATSAKGAAHEEANTTSQSCTTPSHALSHSMMSSNSAPENPSRNRSFIKNGTTLNRNIAERCRTGSGSILSTNSASSSLRSDDNHNPSQMSVSVGRSSSGVLCSLSRLVSEESCESFTAPVLPRPSRAVPVTAIDTISNSSGSNNSTGNSRHNSNGNTNSNSNSNSNSSKSRKKNGYSSSSHHSRSRSEGSSTSELQESSNSICSSSSSSSISSSCMTPRETLPFLKFSTSGLISSPPCINPKKPEPHHDNFFWDNADDGTPPSSDKVKKKRFTLQLPSDLERISAPAPQESPNEEKTSRIHGVRLQPLSNKINGQIVKREKGKEDVGTSFGGKFTRLSLQNNSFSNSATNLILEENVLMKNERSFQNHLLKGLK
eukprot:TRINITY_DN1755_c0_g1_i1.p1 TRINITY_DN1755_c0_g1~~TRINITY_DN1755_c0_g1_i1.p1  ORF type:complete len:727 (+),score=177.08 TRINITY_DN1755_c0_g1_i1:28-2208(+)